MKKTLSIILLLAAINASGQIKRIQITAAGNHPFIPSVETGNATLTVPASSGYNTSTFKGSVKESFEGATGFNLGGSADYHLNQKIFLSSGLTISYLHFKRSLSVGLPEQDFSSMERDYQIGVPMGQLIMGSGNTRYQENAGPTVISSKKAGQTSTLYLQMPVLGGAIFFNDKLVLKAGATFSYLVASTVYKAQYTPVAGVTEVKDTSNDSLTPFLVSATFGASYRVLKNLSVDASANQYLTPIYRSEYRAAGAARYRVIGLGISYIFSR
jgi:hypothetical protein